jgi:hypothetical protein
MKNDFFTVDFIFCGNGVFPVVKWETCYILKLKENHIYKKDG